MQSLKQKFATIAQITAIIITVAAVIAVFVTISIAALSKQQNLAASYTDTVTVYVQRGDTITHLI